MNGGVIAAPTPPPAKGTLVAKPLSLIAIHAAIVRLKLGHAAASPMPTQNRTKPSESTTGTPAKPPTHAVAAVASDHSSAENARTLRGPNLSASQPPGTWNRPYA